MKQIAIVGEGAWGTAVATLLAHNGHAVTIWCYHQEVAEQITTQHRNEKFLPGIMLDPSIRATSDMKEAVCEAHWVFEAIPVKFLRSVLKETKSCFDPDQVWVVLSKGIEKETLLFPTQIIDEIFGVSVKKTIFAGPSFANDVAKKQITAVTVAAPDCDLGVELQQILANDYFRPYITTDMIGVQVGAALKNVIALGVGMLDGAGYTDNAKAFLLTRGLHEMVQLATKLGGKQETLYGLSGIGDLVLTAMGSLSKNLEVGKRLGSGQSLEKILKETGYIPEGINTVQSVKQLMEKEKIDLPICRGIYNVIFTDTTIEQMLTSVMHEPLSWECE
jgi:glycerol-3-phosphate dehydrogenase (NAD(P)+)